MALLPLEFRIFITNYCKFKTFMYICTVENIGYLEVRIADSKGSSDLSPDNHDIRDTVFMLEVRDFYELKSDKTNIHIVTEESGTIRVQT